MSYLTNKHRNISEALPENIEQFLLAKGYFNEDGIIPGTVNPDGIEIDRIPEVDWSNRTQVKKIPRTQSIDMLLEKPDKGIRRFSLMHPYIYALLTREVVGNIDLIRERLLRHTPVAVYSIPNMYRPDDMTLDWQYFSKLDPVNYFSSHPFIVRADISNFYESIYTHTISWAMHGVDTAKSRGSDYALVGNRLDKLFQNARDGQTNGVPTGNSVSNIAAELVLKDIDEAISDCVSQYDIHASRYRDDYLFMCKNKNDARKMIDRLIVELNKGYGLSLNQAKTRFYTADEYISTFTVTATKKSLPAGLLESDRVLRGEELLDYIHNLKLETLEHGTSKKFDAGVKRIVDKLKEDGVLIVEDSFHEWAMILVHELTDAIEAGVSSTSIIYLLIDKILQESHTLQEEIIDYLINVTIDSPNVIRKVWIYALLRKYDPDLATQFAEGDNSSLLNMALASDNQAAHFISRDSLGDDASTTLSSLRIVNIDIFSDIGEDAMIWSIVKSEFYDSILRSHYDA